jgi:hypothetical protein
MCALIGQFILTKHDHVVNAYNFTDLWIVWYQRGFILMYRRQPSHWFDHQFILKINFG